MNLVLDCRNSCMNVAVKPGQMLARINHTSSCAVVERAVVAQVSNLPYRRLPVGKVSSATGTVADWKSAIQQVGNLRYGFTTAFACEISG